MNRTAGFFLTLTLMTSLSSLARAGEQADEQALEMDRLEASSSEQFVDTEGGAPTVKPGALYARLATHYNLRIYRKGNELALQIDVKNLGTYKAYGPRVAVKLKGIGSFPNASLYPYFGGNTSQANTVFPGQLGYIVVTLPAGKKVVQGQAVQVSVKPEGASNFPAFGGTMIGCQKGQGGCE